MNNIVEGIRKELKRNADPKTRESAKNFFKEDIKLYGVKTETVRKIAKENFKTVKAFGKAEIFTLCEKLWQSGYMEESFIACNWSYFMRREYVSEDFKIFEKWVSNYISNWAACDTFCNHTVGAFVVMHPGYISKLKIWAKSKSRWMRRASAVSLIVPAKHGKFLKNIFEISDILLADEDDLVQKGYGWLLKAASRANQKKVFEYVMKRRQHMPRTALRYAIEKMPKALKTQAMQK